MSNLASTLTSVATPYCLVPIPDMPGIVQQFIDADESLGVDVETTGTDHWQSKLITLQLGNSECVYIADLRQWEQSNGSRQAFRETAELLFSGKVRLLAHNGKFDVLALAVHLAMTPDDLRHLRMFDTMLAEQVILGGLESDTGAREKASLDATASRYGIHLAKDPRNWFVDLDTRPEWDVPFPSKQLLYMSSDITTLPSVCAGQARLIKDRGLANSIALEMDALRAYMAMELHGVGVETAGYREYLKKVQTQSEDLEQRIQAVLFPTYLRQKRAEHLRQAAALAQWQTEQDALLVAEKAKYEELPKGTKTCGWGECRKHAIAAFRARSPRPKKPDALPGKLNLGSHVQLQEALSLIGVVLCSTEADELEKAYRRYPDVEALALLVEWRKLAKILGTYGESLLAKIAPDGRLHPNWRQIGSEASGVATGRSSCSEPNLQNLPSKPIAGDLIRNHIVASPGHTLIGVDFNQQEMRVLAERSQDSALLDIFERGKDIYTAFAVAVGLAPEGTTKDESKRIPFGDSNLRQAMKVLTLAVSYGMGPRSLGHDLGVSEEEAGMYLADFYASFPGIKRYQDRTAEATLSVGYSTTICGRRRNFRVIPEPERRQYLTWDGFMAARQEWRIAMSRVRRQAVNHTIQGTAADITKTALSLIFRELPLGSYLIGAIHDEILVEALEQDAKAVADLMVRLMEQAARSYLPTVALGKMEAVIAPFWKEH